jgi:hypothetical protein
MSCCKRFNARILPRLTTALVVLGLGACAKESSSVLALPALVPYSAEMQARSTAEMEALIVEGRAPVLRQMIDDYGALRRRIRAMRAP